jgi:hypothetical protein
MTKSLRFIALTVLLASACAEPPAVDKPRSQMTERERDSTIAESGLPGAGVVKRGLSMADAQARRAAMLDSVTSGN